MEHSKELQEEVEAVKPLYTMEERRKRLGLERAEASRLADQNDEQRASDHNTKWFFSDQQIQELRHQQPWFQSEELERKDRQAAAKLIQQIGQVLHVPHSCIDTAIVLMHRFCIFHPLALFPPELTAMAAFSLASKSCESLRRTEQIIRSMLAASKREKTSSEDLSKISNELEVVEGFMAMTLGYDFKVSHPEKFIDAVFDQRIPNAPGEFKSLAKTYSSISLHLTTFCVRFPPKVVAAICVYMSSEFGKYSIPNRRDMPWFKFLHNNITEQLLEAMAEELMIVYNREPSKPVENHLDQRNSQLKRKRPAQEVGEPAMKSQRLENPQEPHENLHQPSTSLRNNPREEETDEFHDEACPNRKKFESERSTTAGKVAAFHKIFATPTNVRSVADPACSRLLPQQHPLKPQTDEKLRTKSLPQHPLHSPAFIQSLLKTGPNVAELARKKSKPPPATRPKPYGRPPAYEDQPSSSKGIKSTVPMKISAVKAEKKADSLYQRQLKLILDDIPETYISVKKGKQRVAHGSSRAHSEPETPTQAAVNGIGRAGSNQGYWSMNESERVESEPSLRMLESGYKSSTETIQQKAKEKKRKRHSKKKKHQHKHSKLDKQKNGEHFHAPSGSTSGPNADQPSLKFCFKKSNADGEYFIKPTLA